MRLKSKITLTWIKITSPFLFVLISGCQSSSNLIHSQIEPVVNQWKDPHPPGGLYKTEEWVFESTIDNCKLVLRASIPKSSPSIVHLHAMEFKLPQNNKVCEIKFKEKLSVYRALLKAALIHYHEYRVTTLTLGYTHFLDHNERMKKAASNSQIWADYLKRRKNTKFLNGNKEFVELFNEANVGKEWVDLFSEERLLLKLNRVEKVLIEEHLPYQAGIYSFSVEPIL